MVIIYVLLKQRIIQMSFLFYIFFSYQFFRDSFNNERQISQALNLGRSLTLFSTLQSFTGLGTLLTFLPTYKKTFKISYGYNIVLISTPAASPYS
jgi:uncharacterized membrane protein